MPDSLLGKPAAAPRENQRVAATIFRGRRGHVVGRFRKIVDGLLANAREAAVEENVDEFLCVIDVVKRRAIDAQLAVCRREYANCLPMRQKRLLREAKRRYSCLSSRKPPVIRAVGVRIGSTVLCHQGLQAFQIEGQTHQCPFATGGNLSP